MPGTRDHVVSASSVEEPSTPITDETVERLRAEVARAIRKICPQWLADHADDLTQIATLRVLDRLRVTAGEVTFSPGYFYRAAYSVLVDEIRRRRRIREVAIEPDLMVVSPNGNPEHQAKAGEVRAAIMRCLAGLAESRRRAVMLYLQGHTIAETSALLECARKKADNLIYRGLADLRACLTARGVAP